MVRRHLGVLTAALALVLIPAGWILFPHDAGAGSPVRTEADLDGDGVTEEYLLSDHGITVKEGEQVLWHSPEEWSVDHFVIGDPDNDGMDNLTFSLWKTGSFGEIRPFWLTEEDAGYRNHLFVYKLKENRIKPVWCSSDLDCPIISYEIRDVSGDGLNELVVQEGKYRRTAGGQYAPDTAEPVRTTVWQWEEWGFSRTL